MITKIRIKETFLKVLVGLSLVLNLITVPLILLLIYRYVEQIQKEKIYDDFEVQNIVFSKALTTLITQRKTEFTSGEVFDAGLESKYNEIISPGQEINGQLHYSYGAIQLDVEPIPATVNKIWVLFHEADHTESKSAADARLRKIFKEFGAIGRSMDEYQDAMKDFEHEKYVSALKNFESLADQRPGIPVQIGLMYKKGLGADVDYREAEKWFWKAVDVGNDRGIDELNQLYEEHTELNGDFSKIAKLYENAAQYGDQSAQKSLARMYEAGKGVKKNLIVARSLYSLSINKYDTPFKKEEMIDVFKRLDNQLTSEQVEESTRLTNKISRYGHLMDTLSEYLANETTSNGI